jgi:RecA-family ATPase
MDIGEIILLRKNWPGLRSGHFSASSAVLKNTFKPLTHTPPLMAKDTFNSYNMTGMGEIRNAVDESQPEMVETSQRFKSILKNSISAYLKETANKCRLDSSGSR